VSTTLPADHCGAGAAEAIETQALPLRALAAAGQVRANASMTDPPSSEHSDRAEISALSRRSLGKKIDAPQLLAADDGGVSAVQPETLLAVGIGTFTSRELRLELCVVPARTGAMPKKDKAAGRLPANAGDANRSFCPQRRGLEPARDGAGRER